MNVAVVIPARYASQRLPGKPLLKFGSKTLIELVYDRARLARAPKCVVVATDDRRIAEAVAAFGGEVQMTRADHASGTDRIAEVARERLAEFDAIVNVQGDEPEMAPENIDRVAALLDEDSEASMTTLAALVRSESAMADPNKVKVVCDAAGRALYFSRAPIPFVRDAAERDGAFLMHLGIYGYRREFLLKFPALPQTPLEKKEKLEQLRVLEHGYVIRVGITDKVSAGIDTSEDWDRFTGKARR
jgi:3-deoxy-manno-octulosonate cytidylyltransferase (CMP-KDO synthetase)